MTPCACHCAACRVAGHGNKCVEIRKALLRLFGKADVVDLVMRHYYGACGWGTARLDAAINCVQYGPAGDVITAGDDDGRIHFICAQTGEKIVCPLSCDSPVLSIDWHENRIVAGCYDGTIKVFDAQSGDRLATVRCDNAVRSVAYSPDGTKLAAGLDYPSNSVVVFNEHNNEQICSLSGHSYSVNSVCWNSDGTKLASGSNDHTVKVWDSTTGECLWTLNVGCYMFVDRRKPPHGGFPKPAFTEFGSAV